VNALDYLHVVGTLYMPHREGKETMFRRPFDARFHQLRERLREQTHQTQITADQIHETED